MSGAWIAAGALVCAVSILAGAFGAHGLRARFDASALALWETAARYLMYSGLGIVAIALASRPTGGRLFTLAAGALLAGAVIFCGTVAGSRIWANVGIRISRSASSFAVRSRTCSFTCIFVSTLS